MASVRLELCGTLPRSQGAAEAAAPRGDPRAGGASRRGGRAKASTERQPATGPLWKTRLCNFHAAGGCRSGARCPFAHGEEDLRGSPDFERTSVCPRMLNTGSCDRPGCRYAHHADELRVQEGLLKTKMCTFFKNDRCIVGAACRFAHSQDEIREALAQQCAQAERSMPCAAAAREQKLLEFLAGSRNPKVESHQDAAEDIEKGYELAVLPATVAGGKVVLLGLADGDDASLDAETPRTRATTPDDFLETSKFVTKPVATAETFVQAAAAAQEAPEPEPSPPRVGATACARCGEGLLPGQRFCGSCGAPAPGPKESCFSCGASLQIGQRFCSDCGAQVAHILGEANRRSARGGGPQQQHQSRAANQQQAGAVSVTPPAPVRADPAKPRRAATAAAHRDMLLALGTPRWAELDSDDEELHEVEPRQP